MLTTCYNREAYIAETIESVHAQTFTDFEFIIVDDCSKDRSFEIAQSYARKDSRIRVYCNETNLGDYPNRNKAASYATGKYLKYIDSDDVLYPHALDVMVRCIEQFEEAGLGLSANGIASGPYPRCLSPEETFIFDSQQANLFGRAPGSAIIRRSAFESLKGFTGRRQIGDFELWIRLALEWPVVVMPRDLSWARTHANQEQQFDSEEAKHRMRVEALESMLKAAHSESAVKTLTAFIVRLQSDHRRGRMRSLFTKSIVNPLRWLVHARRP